MTDNIKLPPHKPTWAIKETLDKYLSTDDREYVWESIRAYANVQARAAVEADRAQRVVNQSLTAEPGFMEIRELWGASTEAMGGDGLEAMQHFARIVLARYGQPARPVNVPPASISRDLLGRIVDEVFSPQSFPASRGAFYFTNATSRRAAPRSTSSSGEGG